MGCFNEPLWPILAFPKAKLDPSPARHEGAMTEMMQPTSAGPVAPKTPDISFEFFPSKTEEMERNLWDTIKRLAPLSPNFVSVTYGAGGSTRQRTHATIARILSETELTPAAHLTCVDAPCLDVD